MPNSPKLLVAFAICQIMLVIGALILPDIIQNPKVSPLSLAHKTPPYGSRVGGQGLFQQRQLVKALGSSQNGFNGAGTSKQKKPNRLCISSCFNTP